MPITALAPGSPATRPNGPDELRRGPRSPTRRFAIGLARAVGGAIVFALPLLMTMEMWSLGVVVTSWRLALLVVLTLPLLVGLSHVSGFEDTFDVREDVVDAFVAWAVGAAVSAGALLLFGVLTVDTPLRDVVGRVALQAVPASIGALLAQSQLGGHDEHGEREDAARRAERARGRPSSYWSQLFLMSAGALFLAFNVAPTEEIVLIAYTMDPPHVLALAAASLVIMHAFVYALEFSGQEAIPPGTPAWQLVLRFTVVGYALALAISAYVLWTFGRLDDTAWIERVTAILVLAFPAAVGAAAARLLL